MYHVFCVCDTFVYYTMYSIETVKRKKINDAAVMYTVPAIGGVGPNDELVMALTVDTSTTGSSCIRGLVRIITKRIGNENMPGYIDTSELCHVESRDGLTWRKTTPLVIKGIDMIVENIANDIGGIFWGLEDHSIWIDERGIKHVYFTIAFGLGKKQGYRVYLGHAEGETLASLVATNPVLSPITRVNKGFKEVVISPVVVDGIRINLAESNDGGYSVISAIGTEEYYMGGIFYALPRIQKKSDTPGVLSTYLLPHYCLTSSLNIIACLSA
ncbi:MAG: hypothetical protein UY31_C0015G0008 [Candidatus Wolfebacteria bacterium GW2011_GWE1_48_7]|uniref:Uncharacterized protein n=2 Tax=Candidatus Wolfeibacteriota TaxID=1752735 RepID=A0A0G1X764_9BACT|nr:MAG: hypothetical protein UX49_C0003G0021 [Candidatus Wolfebacteria bacterium GW2011_GWC2_46_275]KKU42606.1 MAG: hypothetical protein UX58_C0001G0038 [Candidatus Wolfebacteria bacterium GW2011_GWB2_46_69]KKU54659.1 MAG: hypothetical protein UX76_C0001G0118 [Candidatus Wolfebacteria bacterium GW2011_GWC1_47_103]KKU59170.1 MAG: hypothetical protein UX83_C0007G0018 [Candidatus Wolfebacteria bacterium GW2011_GWE2_47_12]KKU66451.1 MAG: hypothetical protein UX90_C0001G0510 [Candidatus Wolfebacteri